jgi:hypothetical protein
MNIYIYIENRITNHQIKQIMSNKINFYIIHQQFKLVVDKNNKNLKYIKSHDTFTRVSKLGGKTPEEGVHEFSPVSAVSLNIMSNK